MIITNNNNYNHNSSHGNSPSKICIIIDVFKARQSAKGVGGGWDRLKLFI